MTNTINSTMHLKELENAMYELLTLHERTKAPNQLTHQYIGTVVDNTVGLLTAPANSLDGGGRNIRFEDSINWLSLMQSVHRSFLSSLHTSIERGLDSILEERSIIPENTKQKKLREGLVKLGTISPEHEAFITKIIEGIPLGFADKLNSVLSITTLDDETKKEWRKFFRGLGIVRNKVSHSKTNLNDTEREDLIKGGLKNLISEPGELHINSRRYYEFAKSSLDFFDLIHLNLK